MLEQFKQAATLAYYWIMRAVWRTLQACRKDEKYREREKENVILKHEKSKKNWK